MPMQNPYRPGELILHDWIGGLNLTVEAGAQHMELAAQSLVDICQGNAPVTAKMVVRLSKALGSTPRFWIQRQANFDTAQAEAMVDEIDFKRIKRSAWSGKLLDFTDQGICLCQSRTACQKSTTPSLNGNAERNPAGH